VNHIEDRVALLQEIGGPSRALNLVNRAARQPGDLANATLLGSGRDVLQFSAKGPYDRSIGLY
jgi:hypothetical protein